MIEWRRDSKNKNKKKQKRGERETKEEEGRGRKEKENMKGDTVLFRKKGFRYLNPANTLNDNFNGGFEFVRWLSLTVNVIIVLKKKKENFFMMVLFSF